MTRCIHCGGDDHGSNQCSDMPPAVTGDVAQGSLDPVRVALQEWVEQGYIGEDGECQGAAAYAPRLYKQSIAALAAQPPAAPVETELWATLDERPATPVDMKSAPDQRAPQNTTERLPDREVAGSGADTQCSAGSAVRDKIYAAVLEQLEAKRRMPTSVMLAIYITNAVLALNEPQPVCTWPNCDQPSGHDYCYGHCLDSAGSPTVTRPHGGGK